MGDPQVALYARVSSDQQARGGTIASQLAALRERIAADGQQLAADYAYVDDGYSGASLLRPALERLRDAAAAGVLDRVYVHSPDRLARRYAYQVLLIEEFRRAGAEVVFLNRPVGDTAEDDLLLQVQGMIAEYERAKILERSRRGRRHAARSGSVSALGAAPFGSRYSGRAEGGDVARIEGVEAEAQPRPADLRLGRPGAGQPARGLPPARRDRLPHPHRPGALGPDDGLRHAAQPGLHRAGRLRALALCARPAASAADPRPSLAATEG